MSKQETVVEIKILREVLFRMITEENCDTPLDEIPTDSCMLSTLFMIQMNCEFALLSHLNSIEMHWKYVDEDNWNVVKTKDIV